MKELCIADLSLKVYLQEEYHRFVALDSSIYVQSLKISDRKNHFPDGEIPDRCVDAALIFLELEFDPIARIKRGKLYRAKDTQPITLIHQPTNYNVLQRQKYDVGHELNCRHFESFYPTRVGYNLADLTFYFGNSKFESRWKVLNVDFISTNEELFSIKEINGFGLIPKINYDFFSEEHRSEVIRTFDNLTSNLHGDPESVVELSKNAALAIISGYLKLEKGLDMSNLCKLIKDKGKEQVSNYANVIRMFHTRCKTNKVRAENYRSVNRFDADYAVSSVFLIIKDLELSI